MDRDKFFAPVKRLTIFAPFPHISNSIARMALRWVHKLKYRLTKKMVKNHLTIESMNIENLHKYFDVMLQSAKDVNEEALIPPGDDIYDLYKAKVGFSYLVAQKNPDMYAVATGIDDREFFLSLPGSEVEKLEMAIIEVNPSLQREKKNLEEIMQLTLEMRRIRNQHDRSPGEK